VSHLEEIIVRLEQDGFSFVRVDDLATFPKLNEGVPGPRRSVHHIPGVSF
jgi:hypothetical protein